MGLKKLLADHCEHCFACRWAREHPDRPLGRLIQWHGTWCPCWKAWEEHYGKTKPQEKKP